MSNLVRFVIKKYLLFLYQLYYNVRCDALRRILRSKNKLRTVNKLKQKTNFEAESITSRKNAKIIHACSLSEKKIRDREGLFAFEGEKLLEEALLENVEIREVFFTERAKDRCFGMLEQAYMRGARLYEVTFEVYDKLTYEKAGQGILAVAAKKELPRIPDGIDGEGFIVLEGLQDPTNVGAILRTCAALGSKRVLMTRDCADIYGAKALRSSMGAVFKTELYVTDSIYDGIATLKKLGKVYAAALTDGAASIADTKFLPGDSIVIGNEGHGVSKETLEAVDGAVIIPMQCGTESLNASVAAAILIWEKAVKTKKDYGTVN